MSDRGTRRCRLHTGRTAVALRKQGSHHSRTKVIGSQKNNLFLSAKLFQLLFPNRMHVSIAIGPNYNSNIYSLKYNDVTIEILLVAVYGVIFKKTKL